MRGEGRVARGVMVAVAVVVLAGCGGQAGPTATPTKTPVASTATPTAASSTSAPLPGGEFVTETPGVLVQAVVDAAFDEALRYVLERDPATVTADQLTADQLTAALLSVVRRLADGERSPALLEACGTVAAGAATRASGDGATVLAELATACQAGDDGRLAAAVAMVQRMIQP